ncbi:MAG: hypothetical protein R3F14_25010 [Polyangiaceae bacterium]
MSSPTWKSEPLLPAATTISAARLVVADEGARGGDRGCRTVVRAVVAPRLSSGARLLGLGRAIEDELRGHRGGVVAEAREAREEDVRAGRDATYFFCGPPFPRRSSDVPWPVGSKVPPLRLLVDERVDVGLGKMAQVRPKSVQYFFSISRLHAAREIGLHPAAMRVLPSAVARRSVQDVDARVDDPDGDAGAVERWRRGTCRRGSTPSTRRAAASGQGRR